MAMPLPQRIPVSTYRLQFNKNFTLFDAARIVPYLERLGVTELYCSPIWTATPGSTHGYDIVDHSHINPEIGGEEGFRQLSAELRARNMGMILDFVPNHMGIHETVNAWWRDVLENGMSSPYAGFFDIEWYPNKEELRTKVLLPILGNPYGVVLDEGQLQIEFHNGSFSLRYYDRNLPLNPRKLPMILRHRIEDLEAAMPADDPRLVELLSINFQLEHLPAVTRTDSTSIAERQREKEVARRRLQNLVDQSPEIRAHIERVVQEINGTPGDPTSFDLLHQVLEAQPYRLAFWRTAMHEINYRRFFDIDTLAGLRMEEPAVFEATHALALRLIREGHVTGFRLDHIDGLFDPPGYLNQLLEACGSEHRVYTIVEKILSDAEILRTDWAVHGTTGYDYLNLVNSLFVLRDSAHDFRKLYTRITGYKRPFLDVAYASKKLIISTSMASELNVLAIELNRISESDRHYRDFTFLSLQEALSEVVACFPVYRTYFNAAGWDEFDRRNVDAAVQAALYRNPVMETSIFHFIRSMLLPSSKPGLSAKEYESRVRFAMKFQQYTGPVQAKGVEDTAFYRYCPLLSLNEVGGDPGRFGDSVEHFHEVNRERLNKHPLSMSATSTHDTKRGEDARARINVLSEIPQQWREHVMRWFRINSSARTLRPGESYPDRSDEYLYYQALLGAWPAGLEAAPDRSFIDRMVSYMSKAIKEKKVHTSWINPSADYDTAVARFVEETLGGSRSKPFLEQFLPFQKQVARVGMVNSLAQLALKLTSPGVPDTYQNSERWDLNLVDPDNRRPVDFAKNTALLEHLCVDNPPASATTELLEHWMDGRIKMFFTTQLLQLRRSQSKLFLFGDYRPLQAEGDAAAHVVAFARSLGGISVLTIVPRLVASLSGLNGLPLGRAVWSDAALVLPPELPMARYRNIFTSEVVEQRAQCLMIGDLLRHCPAGVFVSQ